VVDAVILLCRTVLFRFWIKPHNLPARKGNGAEKLLGLKARFTIGQMMEVRNGSSTWADFFSRNHLVTRNRIPDSVAAAGPCNHSGPVEGEA
jgi:hypothetical protein